MITIRNRFTGAPILELDKANLSGANLSGANLSGANLSGANLSWAELRKADLRKAELRKADLRGADLRSTDLSEADLRGADLRSTDLSEADLSGADLRGANLRSTDLSEADLSGADLRGANLRRANLSGAVGLPEIPILPNPDTAVLSALNAGGTLKMNAWHTCGTSHCYAGWLVTLTGDKGRALEAAIGSEAAGQLIFAASKPGHEIPSFYIDDDLAMQGIKDRAAKEIAS